jgi:hypothetical protein
VAIEYDVISTWQVIIVGYICVTRMQRVLSAIDCIIISCSQSKETNGTSFGPGPRSAEDASLHSNGCKKAETI